MHILAGTFGKTLYNERKRSNPPSRVQSSNMLAAYNTEEDGVHAYGGGAHQHHHNHNSKGGSGPLLSPPVDYLAAAQQQHASARSSSRVATPPDILTPQLSPTIEAAAESKFVEFGKGAGSEPHCPVHAAGAHKGKQQSASSPPAIPRRSSAPDSGAVTPPMLTAKPGSAAKGADPTTPAMRAAYGQKLY